MNPSRLFTAAALALILVAVALAMVGHLLHALMLLGTVAIGGLVMAIVAWRS
jgi:hypothetical protein